MIVNVIIISISVLFYSLFLVSFYFKSKKVFIGIYLALTIFHDFVFINLELSTSPDLILIVKSWQEILMLFLTANLFVQVLLKSGKLDRRVALTLVIIMVLTAWGVVGALSSGVEPFEMYTGWRKYMIVFVNTFLVYINGVFDDVDFQYVRRMLIVYTAVVVVYAFYQRTQFEGLNMTYRFGTPEFYKYGNGVLEHFWFHDRFGADHMLAGWPNYIRGAQARITSIFVSPIILSEFLAIIGTLIVLSLIRERLSLLKKIGYLLVLGFVLYVMTMSHTRIGFIQIFLGTGIGLLIGRRLSTGIYWMLILFAIGGLIFLLSVFQIGDDSAQGRLPQYINMFASFTWLGRGFGSPESQTYYDSLIISIVFLFGAAVFLYVYMYLLWMKPFIKSKDLLASVGPAFETEFRAITGILYAFIFAFAFQFSIGAAGFTILNLLLFSGLAHSNKLTRSK